MKIGLIDIDHHNFPNLALMKISAYHKAQGDSVGWYDMFGGHFDRVYVAKVFSFSPDYRYPIDADEVIYWRHRKWNEHGVIVYTIVNFNTTPEQDLERIYKLRELGYWAYVMVYDKEHCEDEFYKDVARWVNNRFIFAICPTFDEYLKYIGKK